MDTGSLTDLSVNLNDFDANASVIALTTTGFLYIGSDYPFGGRYFDVSVANSNASTLSVELWTGNNTTWVAATDVIDETSSGGITFAQSGKITWKKDLSTNWRIEATEDIPELSTFAIPEMYWARLKVSADLSGTTALKSVLWKFSEDADIDHFYPKLNSNGLNRFKSGKTNWDEQHFRAGEAIIRELKRQEYTVSENLILSFDLFNEASVHKVAEIVFNGFGKSFEQDRDDARKYFVDAMDLTNFLVDKNQNLILDRNETFATAEVVRRG